jgi:pilus assembly protein CpaB
VKTRIIGAIVAVLLAVTGTVMVLSAVPEGTPAEQLAGMVTVEQVPAKVVPAGTVASLEELAGQVAAVDLVSGEQLLTARFADPASLQEQGTVAVPKGMQEVTISLEPQRVAGGRMDAGDTVGIFMSLEEAANSEDGPVSHLALQKVLVTSIQGQAPAPEGDAATAAEGTAAVPGNSLLVTFAVKAADAEKIVFAQEFGRIWLSKEPETADESGTRELTKEGLYR